MRSKLWWLPATIGMLLGWVLAPALPARADDAPTGAPVVSADPADFTPNIGDGRVLAITQVGTRMIVGGDFTTVTNAGAGTALTRRSLFTFDAATGAVDTTFLPTVNGPVNALAVAPDGSVLVAGAFTTVDGVANRGLARLDPTTGRRIATFAAATNGPVNALAIHDQALYAAGTFSTVGGVPRSNLVRLDPVTGAVDPSFDVPVTEPMIGPAVSVKGVDLTPDGSRLVVIGNFTMVAGQPRTQLAVVRTGTLEGESVELSAWATTDFGNVCNQQLYTYMRGVDISSDGTWMAIVTVGSTTTTAKLCDTTTRWDLTVEGPGKHPVWTDYTGNDSLLSVAVTDGAVYVGGHQRWQNNSAGHDTAGPGAVPRSGIAALDPLSGVPLTWNPGRDRGEGAKALFVTPAGLYVGSDTTQLGGELHARLGFLPYEGGSVNPTVVPVTVPATLHSTVAGGDGVLRGRSFDGTKMSAPRVESGPAVDGIDWSTVRGAFALNGDVYITTGDGRLVARSFDGTSFGPERDLASWFDWSTTSGLAYEDGRLFYTKPGDARLYSRRFAVESSIVGSLERRVSGAGVDSLDWGNVTGLTVASGAIYATRSTTGNLQRTTLSDGVPVMGTTTVVSGPGADGVDWTSARLFATTATSNPK